MKREELAIAYRGDKAVTYDSKRTLSKKWQLEQDVVHRILESMPHGITLIDVPVGTGRFVELYQELGIAASGVDISDDMIARAREKAKALGAKINLYQGSIFKIPAADGSFDCALCIRLLNWLSPTDIELALRELSRVSNKFIVVGIRVRSDDISVTNRLMMIGEAFWRKFLFKKKRRNKTIVHDKSSIHSMFTRLELVDVHSEAIDAGMRGTTYELYLLKKRTILN
jgi:ubiquinone/menaquinone biosynthesis C-methylase UbiE